MRALSPKKIGTFGITIAGITFSFKSSSSKTYIPDNAIKQLRASDCYDISSILWIFDDVVSEAFYRVLRSMKHSPDWSRLSDCTYWWEKSPVHHKNLYSRLLYLKRKHFHHDHRAVFFCLNETSFGHQIVWYLSILQQIFCIFGR